jgi:hypothetical protein
MPNKMCMVHSFLSKAGFEKFDTLLVHSVLGISHGACEEKRLHTFSYSIVYKQRFPSPSFLSPTILSVIMPVVYTRLPASRKIMMVFNGDQITPFNRNLLSVRNP